MPHMRIFWFLIFVFLCPASGMHASMIAVVAHLVGGGTYLLLLGEYKLLCELCHNRKDGPIGCCRSCSLWYEFRK